MVSCFLKCQPVASVSKHQCYYYTNRTQIKVKGSLNMATTLMDEPRHCTAHLSRFCHLQALISILFVYTYVISHNDIETHTRKTRHLYDKTPNISNIRQYFVPTFLNYFYMNVLIQENSIGESRYKKDFTKFLLHMLHRGGELQFRKIPGRHFSETT